jgi:nitrogen fixation protein FixH
MARTPLLATYPHGSRPVFTVVFSDAEGLSRTATACVFKLRSPAGVETVYTYGVDSSVTNTATNTFRFECPKLLLDGDWYCRAVATAGFDAPAEGRIYVERSAFTSP